MNINRRGWLAASAAAISGATLPVAATAAGPTFTDPMQVRYCLNTSTIREQKLSLETIVDLASGAGYDGIEPWIRELDAYVESGGKLADLRKRIEDAGLSVESAIGFAQWIVDDPAQRRAGIEQMKRDMDLVRQIGGTRIAAPPVGMHAGDAPQLDLFAAAERYQAILEAGRETGVVPQVEIWGPSRNLSRLGEAVLVAVESGHPDACILPDVYHIFRGGSPFDGLGLLSATAIHCFHFNDYPAHPPRTEQNDSHRVYPGDGVAPWRTIVDSLKSIGFRGAVSLELFNRDYWQQDPKLVIETGLAKMRALFERT